VSYWLNGLHGCLHHPIPRILPARSSFTLFSGLLITSRRTQRLPHAQRGTTPRAPFCPHDEVDCLLAFLTIFAYFSASELPSAGGLTSTTDVGRFVLAAAPSSALDGTKIYCTLLSSHNTGMWEITSTGEMSAAMTHSLGDDHIERRKRANGQWRGEKKEKDQYEWNHNEREREREGETQVSKKTSKSSLRLAFFAAGDSTQKLTKERTPSRPSAAL
jgi:hypothetical protein